MQKEKKNDVIDFIYNVMIPNYKLGITSSVKLSIVNPLR